VIRLLDEAKDGNAESHRALTIFEKLQSSHRRGVARHHIQSVRISSAKLVKQLRRTKRQEQEKTSVATAGTGGGSSSSLNSSGNTLDRATSSSLMASYLPTDWIASPPAGGINRRASISSVADLFSNSGSTTPNETDPSWASSPSSMTTPTSTPFGFGVYPYPVGADGVVLVDLPPPSPIRRPVSLTQPTTTQSQSQQQHRVPPPGPTRSPSGTPPHHSPSVTPATPSSQPAPLSITIPAVVSPPIIPIVGETKRNTTPPTTTTHLSTTTVTATTTTVSKSSTTIDPTDDDIDAEMRAREAERRKQRQQARSSTMDTAQRLLLAAATGGILGGDEDDSSNVTMTNNATGVAINPTVIISPPSPTPGGSDLPTTTPGMISSRSVPSGLAAIRRASLSINNASPRERSGSIGGGGGHASSSTIQARLDRMEGTLEQLSNQLREVVLAVRTVYANQLIHMSIRPPGVPHPSSAHVPTHGHSHHPSSGGHPHAHAAHHLHPQTANSSASRPGGILRSQSLQPASASLQASVAHVNQQHHHQHHQMDASVSASLASGGHTFPGAGRSVPASVPRSITAAAGASDDTNENNNNPSSGNDDRPPSMIRATSHAASKKMIVTGRGVSYAHQPTSFQFNSELEMERMRERERGGPASTAGSGNSGQRTSLNAGTVTSSLSSTSGARSSIVHNSQSPSSTNRIPSNVASPVSTSSTASPSSVTQPLLSNSSVWRIHGDDNDSPQSPLQTSSALSSPLPLSSTSSSNSSSSLQQHAQPLSRPPDTTNSAMTGFTVSFKSPHSSSSPSPNLQVTNTSSTKKEVRFT
jgi:hypothetical protein